MNIHESVHTELSPRNPANLSTHMSINDMFNRTVVKSPQKTIDEKYVSFKHQM